MTAEEAKNLKPLTKLIRMVRAHKPDDDLFSICYVCGRMALKDVDGEMMVRCVKTLAEAERNGHWLYARNLVVFDAVKYLRLLDMQMKAKALNTEIARIFGTLESVENQDILEVEVTPPRGRRFF